ncbi:MAG: acetolactate synthase [Bacteroidota bacterium]|nr:acetolactate synthase [Bacteroidota bacterium]
MNTHNYGGGEVMTVKQLSVFLENKSGRLTEVLGVLGEQNIHIKVLTIADTSEYGILRLIVSEPEKALSLLKDREFSVSLTDIISVVTPCQAGSFAKVLQLLSDKNISIEYMYAFSIASKAALMIRTEQIEETVALLQQNNMELLSSKQLAEF